MFLLIPRPVRLRANPPHTFTFQYVSINTRAKPEITHGGQEFTFQYVSINTPFLIHAYISIPYNIIFVYLNNFPHILLLFP